MKRSISIFLIIITMLTLMPTMSYAGVEMDSRETIYYPNASQTVMKQSMTIPSGSDSTWNGTDLRAALRAAKNTAADQGFAYSKDKINLLENNYSWTYTIKTGLFENVQTSDDYGSTFTMFYTPPNRPIYSPHKDNDYASLGIYGDGNNPDTNYLPNSVAVEFDNWNNSLVWDSGTSTTRGTHVAITFPKIVPPGSRLEHFAYNSLPNPYSNGSINTVNINWQLVSEGSTADLYDNLYELNYRYYQGTTNYLGTPTVTGSYVFTYQELIDTFIDPTSTNFGISASTASLVGRAQDMQWVQPYQYQINYFYKTNDGRETSVQLKSPKIGSAPLGSFDAGHIDAKVLFGENTNYRLASINGGSRYRIINTTGNVFNFYYEQIPRSLMIKKLDSFTEELMNDVTFTLSDGTTERTFTTVNGAINMDRLYRYNDNLQPITYTLTENKPEGYLPIDSLSIEVNEDGSISIGETTVNDGGEFTITNTPVGTIKINKTDTTDPNNSKPFGGAGFTLEKQTAEGDYESFRTVTPTNEEGALTWNEIPYGTYRITETSVPEGYSTLNNPIVIDLNNSTVNENKEIILSIQNQMTPVMPATGGYGPLLYSLAGAIATLLAFIVVLKPRKETIQ